jgi:hypothetical protein
MLVTALPATIHAQDQTQVIAHMESMRVINSDSAPPVPYTITFKNTTVQKLANGVTITHETYSKVARDSSGREYDQRQLRSSPDMYVTDVNDPVNHTSMNWFSNNKEVTIIHQPDPANPSGTVATHLSNLAPLAKNLPGNVPCKLDPDGPQIEDLGSRTIQGATTNGKRVTRTIKAGAEGNDLPFTVTTEAWYSPELHRNLLQITDDPRTGTHTTEATDIQRGDPDPSLFQIPDGYTIRDVYPGQQN